MSFEGTFKIDRAIRVIEDEMVFDDNFNQATLAVVLTVLREIRETDAGEANA